MGKYNTDLAATRQWLFRQWDALEDACNDASYAAAQHGITNLAVDFSFLYPNVISTSPLHIENINHWLDLSSVYVYRHLREYKDPNILGYRLVLTGPTFLTLARYFVNDFDGLESLLNSKDEAEIYQNLQLRLGLSASANTTLNTKEALASAIAEIVIRTHITNHKLKQLIALLEEGIIIGEGNIIDKELIRRSCSNVSDFEQIRDVIDAYRSDTVNANPADERFTRSIEALSILSCMNISNNLDNGRYVFLGWPKCRAFYGADLARRYHRVVTSPFYRMVTLKETPHEDTLIRSANANLTDRREELQFFFNKVTRLERDHEPLPPLMLKGINLLRNDYLKHLRGDTIMMEADDRKRLAKSLCGKQKEVKEALAQAVETANDSVKTLAELAEEFRIDNLVSGYEFLRNDDKLRRIIRSIKLGP